MIRALATIALTAGLATAGELEDLLVLHNAERTKAKLSPLTLDNDACNKAKWFSEYQAAKGGICKHSHDYGVELYKSGTWGENVAHLGNWSDGTRTTEYKADHVHKSWMGSPGHRANILDTRWKSVGFGKALGRDGVYWTAVFLASAGDVLVMADTKPAPKVEPKIAPKTEAKSDVVRIPDGQGGTYLVPANDAGLLQAVKDHVVRKPTALPSVVPASTCPNGRCQPVRPWYWGRY